MRVHNLKKRLKAINFKKRLRFLKIYGIIKLLSCTMLFLAIVITSGCRIMIKMNKVAERRGWMISIAIVDDEQEHIDNIRSYLDRFFGEKNDRDGFVVSTFRDGKDLLDGYEPKYDIVFLDIEMNDIDGMQTAKTIREKDEKTVLIFVTRLASYALKGYEVEALDFMVKPVDYVNFSVKLKKALKHVELNRNKLICVELSGGNMRWLDTSQISYIEIQNHALIIHMTDEEIKIWGSLKTIAEQLEGSSFEYCNRCYLVNLRYVAGINKNMCLLKNGEELLISRYKHSAFVAALAKFHGSGWGGV